MSQDEARVTKEATPMREKHWEERDVEQKLQALREAVVWMSRELQTANDALLKLVQHSHAPDGSLLAPLSLNNLGGMNPSGGYRPDYARHLKTQRERGDF